MSDIQIIEVRTKAEAEKAIQAGHGIRIIAGTFALSLVNVSVPIIIQGDACPSIVTRGTSAPTIVTRGTSAPTIETWETSAPHIVTRETSSMSGHCGLANARLIAAAPELYEALAWFINDIDGSHTVMLDFDANVDRARAVLAKARGA